MQKEMTFMKIATTLLLILLLLLGVIPASAETGTVAILDGYVRTVFDCDDKLVFVSSVAGGKASVCSIDIDLRNEPYVRAVDDKECITYGMFNMDESFSALFHLVTLCEEIQLSLPEGTAFTIDVLLPNGTEYSISADTLNEYYAWMN